MGKQCKNVGIMGNSFRVMAGLDSVYGYDVAVDETFRALILESDLEKLTCFYTPMQFQYEAIKRKHRLLSKNGKSNVGLDLFSELDMLYNQKEIDIDVLHNVSMEFTQLVYLREFFGKKKFPITYTIHGASYPNYIESFYLMKLLMPFRPYDSLICTSTSVKHAVQRMLDNISESLNKRYNTNFKYEGRLDVIPLGVDTEKFKPMNKKEARKEIGLSEDPFTILWIGRFSAYDKADLLPVLVMYKRLIDKNPDKKIKLVLAGHDRSTMPFIPALQENIKNLGLQEYVQIISQNDVGKRHVLFAAADVFISPIDNVQETFGLTPIEAMACGIPQVVAEWDGYKDTVVDGETGFLIPTYWAECDGDIKRAAMVPTEPTHRMGIHHFTLAQAVAIDLEIFESRIQTLIDEDVLREQLAHNSRNRAIEKYSWKSVINQYQELWDELCNIRDNHKDEDRRSDLEFIQPIYTDAFSKYPTRFLNMQEVLVLTKEGGLLSEEKIPMPRHYQIEDYLMEPQLGVAIVSYVSKLKDNETTFEQIVSHFSEQYNPDLVKRSVMWTIKQGFVKLKKN